MKSFFLSLQPNMILPKKRFDIFPTWCLGDVQKVQMRSGRDIQSDWLCFALLLLLYTALLAAYILQLQLPPEMFPCILPCRGVPLLTVYILQLQLPPEIMFPCILPCRGVTLLTVYILQLQLPPEMFTCILPCRGVTLRRSLKSEHRIKSSASACSRWPQAAHKYQNAVSWEQGHIKNRVLATVPGSF